MKIVLIVVLLFGQLYPQQTPLEKNNYEKLTSYDELTKFVHQIDSLSDILKVDVIGKSVEGRNLYAFLYSTSKFVRDTSKIRVLIFAQQHGDEQSGKEGALILARELLRSENEYLFEKIDLVLISQMNPDGSEKNVRQNAHGVDLNRNHLIITEPETRALHHLFNEYVFEATMDVHEYYPYTQSWQNFGYLKNFDIQIGTTTNPNVSDEIRNISNNDFLPFIEKYLNKRVYSFHNYILGGPPGVELFRYSTYDINDGRQSFGVMNTFSFIMEGKNGRDSIDNIQRRAESQKAGMLCFLEFIYENKDRIRSVVWSERKKFASYEYKENTAIQFDHINTGKKLNLPLRSLSTGTDTVITVSDYHPVVKSLYDVKRPLGYLIPKNLTEVVAWAKRYNLRLRPMPPIPKIKIEKYFISDIDSINFEGYNVVKPTTETRNIQNEINYEDYLFLFTNNLKSRVIVIALEPKSMLGLVTYKEFEHLLKAGEYYPILRVVTE